jgi:SNF2 family DNA or RNA helicase
MKLTYKCPICQKALVLEKEFQLGGSKLFAYKCGHTFGKTMHEVSKSDLDLSSVDGSKHARAYQADGVEFILNSGYNCIIADQMRLGKTPQSLLALKNALSHEAPGGSKLPCLIIVKSANLWQWIREFKTWVTELPNGIFPIQGGGAFVFPGFSAYIISMDTFGLNARCKNCQHAYHEKECKKKNCPCWSYASAENSVRDQLKKIPFKLIIVDEAHSFKNTDSNRSQALVDFVRFMNTGEESTKLAFECNRCGEKWFEEAKTKFDKRIGHVVLHKASACPKCGQYCYIQQQHSDQDAKYVKDPEAAAQVQKLLALGNDSSTTKHERSLALSKAEEIRKKYEIEKPKQEPCGLILLTGTPIMNRAEEYFVPLNLVAPEKFSSLEGFRRQWLTQDSKGRWSRIKPHYLEAFKETIKPYILRREKEDVYTDLPRLDKIFTLIEPDKDALAEQYNKILDKVEAKYASKVDPNYWDLAEDMMELRRICGMMKVMWTADYLETAAVESPAKYAVGIHHKSVRDVLFLKLGGEKNCLKLSGEDDAAKKDYIMRHFEASQQQFLIINMLAGGVGMDFHYCNNVLVLERQWNSATEEQFEFRFYNPDKSIKKDPTLVEYILAKGTLDEWWHDMVREKAKTFGETVANHWDLQEDAGTFRELMDRTLAGRL